MKVLRPELRESLEPPWTALEPVVVGDAGGAPSAYVTVEEDGAPFLRIDVHEREHEREAAPHAFQEAIAWTGFIVIGFGDRVHLVSPSSRAAITIALAGYFGHLYPLAEHLLVADAEHLSCLDRSGALVWRSPALGIDGVLVNDVADGVIEGQGEWDPPGGWRPFRLRLSTGAALSPWHTVRSLVRRFEDALVVTWAFEYREATLLANGRSMSDVLDGAPSERGVAAWLAERMRALEGGTWSEADFYRPSRGNVDPTADEVRAFVARCAEAGVRLSYDDGSDVAAP